ncbi:MAG: Ig-like domain-containing protein [Patescibacteria group bacterium]|nr:Ig-like domain-containing protein [Patescibacteria group bacterium]
MENLFRRCTRIAAEGKLRTVIFWLTVWIFFFTAFIPTVRAQGTNFSPTAPQVVFVKPPSSPLSASTYLFVSVNADTTAVKEVRFFIHGSAQSWEYPADFATELSLYKLYWNITGFADGAYQITARAYTSDGRVGQTDAYVTISRGTAAPSSAGTGGGAGGPVQDPSPETSSLTVNPPATLHLTSPSESMQAERKTLVNFSAEGSGPLATVWFFLDDPETTTQPDATFTAKSSDGAGLHWEFPFQYPVLPAGTYVLSAAGKTVQNEIVKCINTVALTILDTATTVVTPLVVSFRKPPVSPVGAPVYLFAQVNVPFPRVRQVTFRVKSGDSIRVFPAIAVPEIEAFQFYWDTAEYVNGSYVVTAEAEDTDGRHATVDLYLALSRPTTDVVLPQNTAGSKSVIFTFLQPVAGEVRGEAKVVAKVDPPVEKLRFIYGGALAGVVPATFDGATWTGLWDTRTLPAGAYELRAVATANGAETISPPQPVTVAAADSLGVPPPLVPAVQPTPATGNQPPTVEAGANQTVTTNTVRLSGKAGDDGLPKPPGTLKIFWVLAQGPGIATFANATALDTEVKFSQSGSYVLRLQASDGARVAVDTVTIEVYAPLAGSSGSNVVPPKILPTPMPTVSPSLSQPVNPEDVPSLASVTPQPSLDERCIARSLRTEADCQQLLATLQVQAVRQLPAECQSAQRTTLAACQQYLFEQSFGELPRTVPQPCVVANVAGAACQRLLQIKSVPDACLVQQLVDPVACQEYLAALDQPWPCRQAKTKTSAACTELLRQQYVKPECARLGIPEEAACTTALITQFQGRVSCVDAAACADAIVRHFPTILYTQKNIDRLQTIVAPSLNAPITLMPERQVSTTTVRTIEQAVPVLIKSPLAVRLVPSSGVVVVDDSDTVRAAAPAVLVLDADQDGLPDDVERRLGTDPKLADTDHDGYADGAEVLSGFNPLGTGAPAVTPAPVELALAAGRPLEQPLALPDIDDDFVVERVRDATAAASSGGAGLQISGRGMPGEVVALFIYSDLPLVVTTQVNADGNWTYTLRQPLVDGPHAVYVTVNDGTGKAVARSTPLEFFVRSARAASPRELFARQPLPSPTVSAARSYLPLTALVVSVGILLFLGLYYLLRRRPA